nr:hypothetical protein CFP56_03423 [Quercus suber]
MENSREMPNGARFATSAAARSARSSIVVVDWGWQAKVRGGRRRIGGGGREGGAKERGTESWIARGRRNRWRTSAASWIARGMSNW